MWLVMLDVQETGGWLVFEVCKTQVDAEKKAYQLKHMGYRVRVSFE